MEGVVKRYGGKAALDGLSLSAGTGEVYGLIGPNGAGKTTAMSVMAGLIGFDSGLCEVLGRPPRGRASKERARIGFLPEEPVFADALTAREYLDFIGAAMGFPRSEGRSASLLATVSLSEAAGRRIAGFSRGMRQRLGLACALLGDPELLILDEPSSALDPEGRKDVVEIIRGLKEAGRTVILSTHILHDIERICDRVALVDHGGLLFEGTMSEALESGVAMGTDISISRPFAESEAAELSRWPLAAKAECEGTEAYIEMKAGVEPDSGRSALTAELARLGLPLVSLNPRKRSLEDVFLAKVGRHE
jgi:ABC-2 type transport system ATP-binding protein